VSDGVRSMVAKNHRWDFAYQEGRLPRYLSAIQGLAGEDKENRITKERLIELLDEYVGFPPGDIPAWVDWELAVDAIIEEVPEEKE